MYAFFIMDINIYLCRHLSEEIIWMFFKKN
jgi:hypothetical protein